MKNRIVLRAAIDGIFQGFLLFILGEFLISIYAQKFSLEKQLLLCGILAISSAIVYYFLLFRSFYNKVIKFSLYSIVWFCISVFLMFINYLTVSFHILPIRQLNEGDGIILIITDVAFILLSIFSKLTVFLISLIKSKKNKKKFKIEND